MPYINHLPGCSQVQLETAIDRAEFEAASYACCCPRCGRFGIGQDHDDHYAIVYQCSGLEVCILPDKEIES